jgi:hypothetical protein
MTSVTTGTGSAAWIAALVFSACSSCSGEWKKIAERYWLPTSGPCRFGVVGSWFAQKTASSSS